MQSTGQTSTQALSFTLMQGSAMIYGIRASRAVSSIWSDQALLTRRPYCVKQSGRLDSRDAAHCVRSRGSSASRSESPKRLNANTERLIARPGKMAIQGAVSANSTRSEEHTLNSSHGSISYAVFCLKKKK